MRFGNASIALQENKADLFFRGMVRLVAFLIVVLVCLMAYEMYASSAPTREKFGFTFFFSSVWDPVQDQYGALPFIYGTLVSSFIALLLAVPISIGIAVVLSELAPPILEKPLSFVIELLAGIPSIVYGLWGFFVLVPWLRSDVEPLLISAFGSTPFFSGTPFGIGMLAAGIILAIMILPIVASISRDVLNAVPRAQREAALALGSTRWESTVIALRYSRSGIIGSAILGLGRAFGETMAVTMVIGNRPGISASLLDPASTMASVLANEFTEATSTLYVSALVEIALALFIVAVLVNSIARLLVWSVTRQKGVRA
jgi:phosphate transport system permease protein